MTTLKFLNLLTTVFVNGIFILSTYRYPENFRTSCNYLAYRKMLTDKTLTGLTKPGLTKPGLPKPGLTKPGLTEH